MNPSLDFAGLAAHLDGGTEAWIGPGVMIRRYGTDPKLKLPPVVSVEYRGVALAFVRPDSVRFPDARESRPRAWTWLSRVVADNGLGTDVVSVKITVRPGVRSRRLAIDADPSRPLAGRTYQIPEIETRQETA